MMHDAGLHQMTSACRYARCARPAAPESVDGLLIGNPG